MPNHATPAPHRRTLSPQGARRLGVALAAAGLLVGAGFAWGALRPISAPDALNDPLAGVMRFALLDRDFNRLPVEERMRLVLELAERLRGMDAGDSALLAAFAAGIRGAAREQLEENIRVLGMDLMTSYAAKYAAVPEEERAAFLDATAVEWSKTMEQLTGETKETPDDQRLAEMKDQAQRDAERARENARPLTGEGAANFFQMMQEDVSAYKGPNDRARTSRFIRDMTRRLRGGK